MKEHKLLFWFSVRQNTDETYELGKEVSGLQKDTLHGADRYLVRNRRRRIWRKIVNALACVVMFCTTYMLILPAITLGNTTYCGYEMHQHSPACYEETLICDQEETETAAPADAEDLSALEHRNQEETETAAPTDTEDLTALEHRNQEETETTAPTDTEDLTALEHRNQEETETAAPTDTEDLTALEQDIIYENENPEHQHTEECYEQVLTCGLEEHTHEPGCYSNPEADVESPEIWQQGVSGVEQTTRTYEGEDYTITVTYGPEAEIPENAELIVSEYAKDSEHYQERYAQAAELYGWEEDRSDSIRLFNIGFYVDDKEIEPAAGVEVTVTYDKQEKAANYKIIHFGGETEEPKTESTYENGRQNIDFTLDHFSDIMLVALAASDLNGQTFALFSPANLRVMTAVSTKLPGKLDAAHAGYYFDSNGDIYIYPTTTEGQESPNYELWTFKSVGTGANTYYIETTVDGQTKYLTIDGENVTVEDLKTDETEKAAKQVITVTEGTGDYAGQVRLTNAAGYAVNKYGGQNIYKEYFGGYNAGHLNDVNDYFYLAKQGNPTQIGTVMGVTPNGTVINVFDYWVTERIAPEGDFNETVNLSSGINKGHVLKFTRGEVKDSSTGAVSQTNNWTGDEKPRKGLVEITLGADGYPHLTQEAADNSGTTDNTPESLAYLFDPTVTNAFKETVRNVSGLLQIDEEGYYYYNSQKNFAQLDETTRQFTLYNTWGVKKRDNNKTDGQFFPFNKFSESHKNQSTSKEINHYFGLTMKSRFVQRHGGHTTAKRKVSTVFDFSGDDDVWVFIDGVLVGDLGGIHDRASLAIDFSSGNVSINGEVVRTLRDAFIEAKVKTTADEWNGNTFADNTYHTLKFYYLERGNYDSNMSLKYNLTAVPETTILKTDQYGNPLKDVGFAIYKADSNWNLTDPQTPVYTGTTNEDGELVFLDDDEKPYMLKELREIFGDHCILKETSVPRGHRLVDREVRLRISDRALWCENTYDSGVWAMVTLQISAPQVLKLVNRKTQALDDQPFYDDEHGESNGILFGVVAKRVGNGDISDWHSWALVSGDSESGYVVHEQPQNVEGLIQQAIDIAKKKRLVFQMENSGAMELTMDDLPGHVYQYYYMLPDAEKKDARFTTSYYWTSANSLEEATTENTYRVSSSAAPPNAFERVFGAKIEVPNLRNRLLVQKFDENGELINGATFALFKANEDGSYLADDGSSVTLEEGKYTITSNFSDDDNQNQAVITTTDGKKITSVEQRQTSDRVLHDTPGTCAFGIREKLLEKGCYYLREVVPPPGYELNPEPVMVRVTDTAIYANAGTAGDGVQVARGPGYISSTLRKAASAGDINNTLTWIYQKLRVSPVSTSFRDLPQDDQNIAEYIANWDYAKDENNQVLASYLIYTPDAPTLGAGERRFLANYKVDPADDRPAMEGTVRTHVQQIATDVGWSYNEIYQDHAYGSAQVVKNGKNATYEDLQAKGDISDLFSRSVYVQVTDKKFSNLEISKTVAGITESNASDAAFTFTVTVEGAAGEYPCNVYNISDSARKTPVETGKISSGGTINLKNGQVAVITGLPVDARYTVTETAVNGYNTSYSIDGAASQEGNTATGTLAWKEGVDSAHAHIPTVDFTNTIPLDLTLQKYAAGTTTPLSGAKFVLRTTGETETYYKKTESGEVSWVSLDSQNTLQNLALTTDADGRITFENLPDGGYSLKEIAAPDGFYLLEGEITFTVRGGKVAIESDNNFTENTVTVYNSTGYELPESGGAGTTLYTVGGLLLIAGAGSILVYGNRKRRTD